MIKGILLGLALFFFDSSPQEEVKCKVFGSVHVMNEKRGADYLIYLDDSEAFADLLVFKEEHRLYADRSGFWFMEKSKGLADFRVFLTKNRDEADFSIYYVDSPTFAGCDD